MAPKEKSRSIRKTSSQTSYSMPIPTPYEAPGAEDENGHECAIPAPPVQAEAQKCAGGLVIKVYDYTDGDQKGDWKKEYPPVVQHSVTISGPGPFAQTLYTDAQGEIRLDYAKAGEYHVSIEDRPGFEVKHEAHVFQGEKEAASHRLSDPVEVREGETTEVHAGYTPLAAKLQGVAYVEDRCPGQPLRRHPLQKAMMHVYSGEKLVKCVETDDKGAFTADVWAAGLLTLVPAANVQVNNRSFRLNAGPRITVNATAGQACPIEVPYAAQRSVVKILAVRKDPCPARCGDEGSASSSRTPIAGMKVDVFRANVAKGTPEWTTRTNAAGEAFIMDLEEGDYVFTADESTASCSRSMRLAQPPSGSYHLHLFTGQTIDALEFSYEPCGGKVMGNVRTGSCQDGKAGIGVRLRRLDVSAPDVFVTTDTSGTYSFDGLETGRYAVGFENPRYRLADGSSWEVSQQGLKEHQVHIQGGATHRLNDLHLEEEEHRIDGVVRHHGEIIPHAEVQLEAADGAVLARTTATAKGEFTFVTETSGSYYIRVVTDLHGAVQTRTPVVCNSRVFVEVEAAAKPSGTGGIFRGPGNGHGPGIMQQAVTDFAAYPMMTEPVDPSNLTRSAAGGSGAFAGANLGRVVESAIREVIGWRPRLADPRGFEAALTQSFTTRDIEGHTQVDWTPKGAGLQVQADMGAITGAQASIFARGKSALEDSLPLLDGLLPLIPDFDPQDTEAIRSIVRTELNELVQELGLEGGPRVPRIEELFTLLLGANPNLADPEQVQGQLLTLRNRFGLDRAHVNTIEEERDLTNFIILVDYVNTLRMSWNAQRQYFIQGSGAEPFLGTQLVLVSRALAVMAESVQEVEFTMDSVFMGGAERLTSRLWYTGGQSLLVQELLDWVERFAVEEGPRLITDGGKDGVVAAVPTMQQLGTLVRQSLLAPEGLQAWNRVPDGFRAVRVQRAVRELAEEIDELVQLSVQIRRAP